MNGADDLLSQAEGFEWDNNNAEKNWRKHGVMPTECEQIFFNQPLVVWEDWRHSRRELRYRALGHTNAGRLLLVVFTLRRRLFRVISARDMTRREKEEYRYHV
jgi:uncharacterized protein